MKENPVAAAKTNDVCIYTLLPLTTMRSQPA